MCSIRSISRENPRNLMRLPWVWGGSLFGRFVGAGCKCKLTFSKCKITFAGIKGYGVDIQALSRLMYFFLGLKFKCFYICCKNIDMKNPIRIFVILLSVFMFGCNDSPKPKQDAVPPLTDITICQWGQALIYLPLYIAQEEGYFKEEGLNVKIINGGGDDLTWATVTSGNAQFGIADPTMIAIQKEAGGEEGRIIGDIVQKVAFWAVTLDKNMPVITSPEGFKGQTIACFKFPNTAHALALRTLQKGNLKPGKDAKLVEVNYEAVLAQLQNKEASLAMVLEPAASVAEVDGGARVVYSYPEDWGVFAFTGLTTTKKYIDQHPEIVEKVVRALNKAMVTAYADFNKAVEVGMKAFPDLKKEVVERAVRRMLDSGTLPRNITPNEEGWNKAIDVCVQVQKLKVAPDPATMIDASFANKVVSQ